jgi:hypothetical protein
VCALDHSATGCDRRATRQCGLRSGLGNSVGEKKKRTVSSIPTLPPAMPRVFQALRYALVGAFIFLPRAYVGMFSIRRAGNLLVRAAFFECGDIHRTQPPSPGAPERTGARRPTSECR